MEIKHRNYFTEQAKWFAYIIDNPSEYEPNCGPGVMYKSLVEVLYYKNTKNHTVFTNQYFDPKGLNAYPGSIICNELDCKNLATSVKCKLECEKQQFNDLEDYEILGMFCTDHALSSDKEVEVFTYKSDEDFTWREKLRIKRNRCYPFSKDVDVIKKLK